MRREAKRTSVLHHVLRGASEPQSSLRQPDTFVHQQSCRRSRKRYGLPALRERTARTAPTSHSPPQKKQSRALHSWHRMKNKKIRGWASEISVSERSSHFPFPSSASRAFHAIESFTSFRSWRSSSFVRLTRAPTCPPDEQTIEAPCQVFQPCLQPVVQNHTGVSLLVFRLLATH